MKRLLDIFFAVSGLLFLFPLFLWLAWRVRKDLGAPVFFTQNRTGKDGQQFRMIKFRSMRDHLDTNGQQLPDGDRLTPFGRKLRSSSADELPELWNVLTGKMSLVGPRPLLIEYLPLYSEKQARRHEVKPGITGWAQINGRNAISWEDKLALDVWYVDNQSFWLDLKIIWLTICTVIKRSDISASGEETMTKFTGNKPPPS